MIKRLEEGYDDVYGKRITRGKEPWLRKTFSLLFYEILQKTTKIEILPNVGDFRLLDRKCINILTIMCETDDMRKVCIVGLDIRKLL